MPILVLNCGSSSVKFAVIDPESGNNLIVGLGQRLGSPQASLGWQDAAGKQEKPLPGGDHSAAIAGMAEVLKEKGLLSGLTGIGHRVLHGGSKIARSVVVDQQTIDIVTSCNHLGPLHNPPNLLGIRLCGEMFPSLRQVAVLDTAFHQTMPAKAFRYAVPEEWYEKHDARRYGFHGTSHRFVSAEACKVLGSPKERTQLIVAHLGNGCSACAVKDGKCADTTMGLTPLEGVMMGTRSGDVDPALVAYMCDRLKTDAKTIVDILNKQSGLLGMSGLSNDMRTVIKAAESGNQRAQLAIEVFCYRQAKYLLGLCAALDRLDALVFTGGIGENSVPIRALTVAHLKVLGLELDAAANAANGRATGGRISISGSKPVLVVPTNEELLIARDTAELLGVH